ncbi:DUF998 domain-containing protein [Micromonospora sp. NPDC005189]|uniref:DUF998 domain-containing protein n=1 Tax=unclassified Micromonospora TaxID=2617518 RepID=UPI0033B39273
MTSLTTAPEIQLRRTRILLGCGTVAGLLFPVLSFGQAFTRSGFDLRRHAVSSLTLGDLGWLQVIAFVGTGLLAVAFAVGLWRALRPGRAGTVGPVLVGVYGVAMVGGGIFVPDPALGWPPGAPAGLPEQVSTGSVLHTVCGAAAFLSLIAAGRPAARPTLRRPGAPGLGALQRSQRCRRVRAHRPAVERGEREHPLRRRSGAHLGLARGALLAGTRRGGLTRHWPVQTAFAPESPVRIT